MRYGKNPTIELYGDVMDEQGLHQAGEYVGVFWRTFPLVIIGGLMALALNFSKVMEMRPWIAKLYTLISVVVVGGAAAFVAVLCIPLFPEWFWVAVPKTPESDMVIAAIAGSCGQKVFDVLAWRLFRVERRNGSTRPSPEGKE